MLDASSRRRDAQVLAEGKEVMDPILWFWGLCIFMFGFVVGGVIVFIEASRHE